jgi:hypothetical protein
MLLAQLLAASTVGYGADLGEGGAAHAVQLLAAHLLAAATDKEAAQLLVRRCLMEKIRLRRCLLTQNRLRFWLTRALTW